MFLIIPLTVSLLLLLGLALVQLAFQFQFDSTTFAAYQFRDTVLPSPRSIFQTFFPRLPFCSSQFPFAISNDRPQNYIGIIPNLQINMTTGSYIFRKKEKQKSYLYSFKERLSSVDEWDSVFYRKICIFLILCVYKTNFLSLDSCSICCKSFKNCSSLQDHCELLSHWSEEDSDEESGDEFDSDEYLFSSSDDE